MATASTSPKAGMYWILRVGSAKQFAVPAERVTGENENVLRIVPLKGAPHHILGFYTSYRLVVPVVDARPYFGVTALRPNEDSEIVEVRIYDRASGVGIVGLLTDGPSEAMNFVEGQFSEAEAGQPTWHVADVEKSLHKRPIVDVRLLFSAEQLATLGKVATIHQGLRWS